MLNLKLQTNTRDIPNLICVDISGQDYYFTGDFAEIQSLCVQNQFQNFYPYKDFFTVNDIKAFDSSSVTSKDSPREIVDLMGFRSIEEVQFKQEVDAETQPIEEPANEPMSLEGVLPEEESAKLFMEEFDKAEMEAKGEVSETTTEEKPAETLEETEDYEVPSKKGKKK